MTQPVTAPSPPPTAARSNPPINRRWGLLMPLVVALALAFIASLAIGSVNIPPDQVAAALLGREVERPVWAQIVLNLRLPKATTAALAGAALSVSGLMLQTFFRNPLADPFILGISSGASLGVALVVLTAGVAGNTLVAGIGLTGDFALAAAAAAGSAIALLLILAIARRMYSNTVLLIVGLMFGYFATAIVTILLYFAVPERIQAYLNWTFGSFGSVTWGQLRVIAPAVAIGLLLALLLAKSLNALLLGEVYARSMGVNLRRARTGIMISTAVLAGTITAFCGPIAFLGVAVPHLCRSLFRTSDHRLLIPGAVVVGAILSLLTALIAEVPGSSAVLPLNAVTALIGAPVVVWIILSRSQVQKSFDT